ncbi:MAG: hypothetical protein V8S54_03015 [Lachnospiraceae bacterium]
MTAEEYRRSLKAAGRGRGKGENQRGNPDAIRYASSGDAEVWKDC